MRTSFEEVYPSGAISVVCAENARVYLRFCGKTSCFRAGLYPNGAVGKMVVVV